MSIVKTIYIVDDDEDDLFLMREAISDSKVAAHAFYASNGYELLNMLDKHVGDALILVDMNMPILNGIETLRALYANPNFTHLRSILISTSDSIELQTLALESGAMQFICKPFTFDEYVKLVKEIFSTWDRNFSNVNT